MRVLRFSVLAMTLAALVLGAAGARADRLAAEAAWSFNTKG